MMPCARLRAPHTARSQCGFTLVELLVAVMIFSIGLLAMAGTASVILTTLAGSQARTIGASVAESRFERIRATACKDRTSGSAVSRGIAETWTRTQLARADDVTVTVRFLTNHRLATQTFGSYVPC